MSKKLFLLACGGLKDKETFEAGLKVGWIQEAKGFWAQDFGPLHAAAHGNQVDHVRRLIDAGAEVNLRDDYAASPLMLACEKGNEDMVELLLKAGAKTDCLNARGQSPLVLAAGKGSDESVRRLLAAGAQVDYGLTPGWTALTEACLTGRMEVVLTLLAAGASVVGALAPAPKDTNNMPSGEGEEEEEDEVRVWEPLFSAAIRNQPHCVTELLKAGASIEARDGQGHTALMLALSRDGDASARVLMAAGADLDAINAAGHLAPDVARGRREHWQKVFQVERVRREVVEIDGAAGVGVSAPRISRI